MFKHAHGQANCQQSAAMHAKWTCTKLSCSLQQLPLVLKLLHHDVQVPGQPVGSGSVAWLGLLPVQDGLRSGQLLAWQDADGIQATLHMPPCLVGHQNKVCMQDREGQTASAAGHPPAGQQEWWIDGEGFLQWAS